MSDEVLTINDLVIQHSQSQQVQDNSSQQEQAHLTQETKIIEDNQQQVDVLGDLLKELGINSVDELKTKVLSKQPEPQLSEDDRQKQEEQYEASLIQYAVKNGDMKLEDFNTLNELKKAKDADLVYKGWAKTFKEENPDIKEEEFDEEARQSFETEYGLNSLNEKKKQRGESRITKEAKEIKSPYESSYQSTKEKYDRDEDLRKSYPDFDNKMGSFSEKSIPEKLNFFNGKFDEVDVPVILEITEADKKELVATLKKELATPEMFMLYKKGDTVAIDAAVNQKAKNILDEKYRDIGLQQVAKEFAKKGFEKGGVGAKNPFPLTQQASGVGTSGDKSAADKATEILNSLEGKK